MVEPLSHYPKYSIVVPAYNESARILKTLESILACIRQREWPAEVIVVNDGSADNTVEIVERLGQSAPEIRVVHNPGNRGKGFSVKHGMLEAKGEVLLFTDADLSSPIEEAVALFSALEKGADIAIGSRWLDVTLQTERQPLYRQFFSRCFNRFIRLLMGLKFADTQCGFKAFTREAANTVFQLQTIDRWGFDPEILFIGLRRGYWIVEVPVTWGHDERTRLSYIKDGLRMLQDVAQVRWNALCGRYSKSVAQIPRKHPKA